MEEEGEYSSSETSSDEDEVDSDIGDPFEDVDEGGLYAFKVRGHGRDVQILHRRVVR
jgi:hypothetical protein